MVTFGDAAVQTDIGGLGKDIIAMPRKADASAGGQFRSRLPVATGGSRRAPASRRLRIAPALGNYLVFFIYD